MQVRALTALIAASIVLGCSSGEPGRAPAGDAGAGGAADSTTRAASPPRYEGTRTLDLTGDGRADSLRIEAAGAEPDSLRITLSLVVDGSVKHTEEWGSSYELALADAARRSGAGADTLLRERLDSVLASVLVEDLNAPGVQVMAEDSAILAGLEPRPTRRISFSYGYETTVRLVWDAPRQRFVRLWSCC